MTKSFWLWLAVGSRGPAKGEGGRPRKANKPRPGDGYVRQTVGPPSKGTQTYAHRVKAGIVGRGRNVTADHLDANTANNSKGNLQVVSRSVNIARENRRRSKKPAK